MIKFIKDNNSLIFQYTQEMGEDWINKSLQEDDEVIFKQTFLFTKDLQIKTEKFSEDEFDFEDEFETYYFLFARLKGDYYKVKKGILTNHFDIFLYKDIHPTVDFFVADLKVSVFNIISHLAKEDFYIGGESPNAIPVEAFSDLLRRFPTSYERRKYVEARVASVLKNYLSNVKDAEPSYQKYLNNRVLTRGINLTKTFQNQELLKFETLLHKLNGMLVNETQYSERQWQEEILQIILLLYPKYIYVFKSVPIKAKFAQGIKEKQLDFLLADSNGYIDIIEIKKPFENAIMTKSFYRDNYIPLRELSGTVMQLEKYVYYLNRWGIDGEIFLTKKYKDDLPAGLELKITNPVGMIIMGRDNNLSVPQKKDFEVVKRKYRNVADIITYDDLLGRLRFTIEQIKKL